MKTAEPMTTFTLDEWRAYKRAIRHLKYVQRMRQSNEADPTAYLEALRREHDPYEHERASDVAHLASMERKPA